MSSSHRIPTRSARRSGRKRPQQHAVDDGEDRGGRACPDGKRDHREQRDAGSGFPGGAGLEGGEHLAVTLARSRTARQPAADCSGAISPGGPVCPSAAQSRARTAHHPQESPASACRSPASAPGRAATVVASRVRGLAAKRAAATRPGIRIGDGHGARRVQRSEGAQPRIGWRRPHRRGPHQLRHTWRPRRIRERSGRDEQIARSAVSAAVSQPFASWNQIAGWLRRLDSLRGAA